MEEEVSTVGGGNNVTSELLVMIFSLGRREALEAARNAR